MDLHDCTDYAPLKFFFDSKILEFRKKLSQFAGGKRPFRPLYLLGGWERKRHENNISLIAQKSQT